MALFSRMRLLGLCAAFAVWPALLPAWANNIALPPANGVFDYQIGETYPPGPEVEIVVRDRTDPAAPGRYTICYVNAFQTQASESGWWRRTHPDLLLEVGGNTVEDEHWPGEYLLDTSSDAKRRRLAEIIGAWIDGCAADGFDAIEADNLDSWMRSKGALNEAANAAFARLLAERAHRAGLAIAQKNAVELAPMGKTGIGFDFAIAEECQVWSECDDYIAAYGSHVFEIEYSDNNETSDGRPARPEEFFARACAERGRQISVIYRNRSVEAPGSAGYVYRHC